MEICNTPQALALRTSRKKKELTIAELSRRTGIKVHVLERYDIGRTSISYENAKILSAFFDVDLERFLDDYLKFIYCDGCDEFIKWFKENKLSTYELTKDRKYRHLKEPLERILNKDFSKFDRRSYKAFWEMFKNI